MSPPASEAHYRRQSRLAALASSRAARAWESGDFDGLGRTIAVLQLEAASAADPYLDSFDADTQGRVQPLAFVGIAGDGRSLLTLLRQAESEALLQIMAASAVQDAGRGAVSAGITARPRIAGYVRMLTPPSCARCAVLAGRRYRWSQGFQRHPRCDCTMIPAAEDAAGDLRTDPVAALRAGQVKGLSQANTTAILDDGADMSRVVNRYGVLASGQPRVLPGSRVMPESLYRLADGDRSESIRLLRQAGFITT